MSSFHYKAISMIMNNLSDFRKDIEVHFPVASARFNAPANYIQTEDMIRMLEWERSKITEDMEREEQLHNTMSSVIVIPKKVEPM